MKWLGRTSPLHQFTHLRLIHMFSLGLAMGMLFTIHVHIKLPQILKCVQNVVTWQLCSSSDVLLERFARRTPPRMHNVDLAVHVYPSRGLLTLLMKSTPCYMCHI